MVQSGTDATSARNPTFGPAMRYRRVLQPGATYFFTLVTYERAKLFADATNVDRWRAAVAKVQRKHAFSIEAEVILPDHLHVLWTMPDSDADYATRIRLVKTEFTKSLVSSDPVAPVNISRAKKGEREIWQRRYWEHTIRNECDFQVRLDYIHYNPVQHALVDRAADWPHSTFQALVSKGAYDPWWGSNDMPPLPEWAQAE